MTRSHRAPRTPANAGLVSLLNSHLDLFRALGFHVDTGRIGDPEHPSVEIVPGLIWTREDNVTHWLPVDDTLAAQHFKELRKRGRHYDVAFQVRGITAGERYDRAAQCSLPLDMENLDLLIRPASVNCTTNEKGESILPIGTPVDCVVLWRYENGTKCAGYALPFDLDGASEKGWFLLSQDPTRRIAEMRLFPVRSFRGRGRRELVEGQAYHPSGKLIVCTRAIDWERQGDYYVVERANIFVAVPLSQVDSVPNVVTTSIAEIEEKPELGPEEYDCGAYRGNVWSDLTKFGVKRTTSYADLKKARRLVAADKHPDKISLKFKRLIPDETLEDMVAAAGLQFPMIQAAFERALEIRGNDWDAVEESLGDSTLEQVLDGAGLRSFRNARTGEDLLTLAVATALGEPFDWKNDNHVGLRRKALTHLAKAARVTEPDDEAAADSPPDEAPPAPTL
ncbi:hypothetical protein A2348_02365 [Candidatus Uhrbacteria bacterium RIFOXYB12_FULL_58_10]|nr:MAG: hypothetical protein A2348_02365 [Candidatus Uhrbacteria bacterium RIFOXYB12_FULL_58_10]